MPDDVSKAPSRSRQATAADLVAIVIGLSLIGLALYGGSLIDRGHLREIRNADAVWMVEFLSGSLTLLGVGLAQWDRWIRVGRWIIAVAGVLLLVGIFAFGNLGWRALSTSILPGVILLFLSMRIRPLPPADDRSAGR